MHSEKHEYILKKYNKILNRVKHVIGKGLHIEVVYDDEYMTTKIKSYKDETNFNKE